MEFYKFIGKNQDKRAASIFDLGKLLLIRQEDNYHIVLYDMGKFYGEIWYHTEKNRIDMVRGFRSFTPLESYLEMIDFSDLSDTEK